MKIDLRRLRQPWQQDARLESVHAAILHIENRPSSPERRRRFARSKYYGDSLKTRVRDEALDPANLDPASSP